MKINGQSGHEDSPFIRAPSSEPKTVNRFCNQCSRLLFTEHQWNVC